MMGNATRLVIIGGSNAYWEINELIRDINLESPRYEVVGVLDDNPQIIGRDYNGVKVDGPIDKATNYPSDTQFVFAIGSHSTRIIRQQVLARLGIPVERFATLVHPTAKIFSSASVAPGCILHYGTIIYCDTQIGPFSIIAANCVIAVGNIIGRGALMGSSITTTLGVKIGCFSFIGSGTNIGEGVEVGPGAKVGMGSLVLRDVPEGAFILGQPPRILEKVEVPQCILSEWAETKSRYNEQQRRGQ
jgi:Serine acetyltransferase